jgi:hypothetical protein
VIDDAGDTQILVFASEEHYRIPIELIERILNRAKETVRKGDGQPPFGSVPLKTALQGYLPCPDEFP